MVDRFSFLVWSMGYYPPAQEQAKGTGNPTPLPLSPVKPGSLHSKFPQPQLEWGQEQPGQQQRSPFGWVSISCTQKHKYKRQRRDRDSREKKREGRGDDVVHGEEGRDCQE